MKSQLISAINGPFTDNGALTNSTSKNLNLDFFFSLGSARYNPEEVTSNFFKALAADPLTATRILFHSRDIRGGQGERNLFRKILKESKSLFYVEKNLHLIPEYGRWDDLIALVGTELEDNALALWASAIRAEDPLACKWAPREKSSNMSTAMKLCKTLGLTPRNYRKILSKGTKVVETQMCSKSWDEIVYSYVPSRAMKIYKEAFNRHTPIKWGDYIEGLIEGVETINSSTLYPHEIVLDALNFSDTYDTDNNAVSLIQAQWDGLPDYIQGSKERILPLVDVSGSMYTDSKPRPIDVSIALGIYIAERNNGKFKNCYMTFSSNPVLEQFDSNLNLVDIVSSMRTADWGMSTDLSKVFQTLLTAATNRKVPEEDMPSTILILSDMEFDTAMSNPGITNFEEIKQRYAFHGFKLPKIVFWNINASSNVPVTIQDENTLLVGGFSPSIMKYILATGSVSPMDLLNQVVNSSRYKAVTV
jgi:hypothetical protein